MIYYIVIGVINFFVFLSAISVSSGNEPHSRLNGLGIKQIKSMNSDFVLQLEKQNDGKGCDYRYFEQYFNKGIEEKDFLLNFTKQRQLTRLLQIKETIGDISPESLDEFSRNVRQLPVDAVGKSFIINGQPDPNSHLFSRIKIIELENRILKSTSSDISLRNIHNGGLFDDFFQKIDD